MHILALPDLHGFTETLPLLADELLRADVVLLVGDLTTGGPPDRAIRILTLLQTMTRRVLAICGNWDTPATAAALTVSGCYLDDQPQQIQHIAFLGMGGALGNGTAAPNTMTEEDYHARFRAVLPRVAHAHPWVLVCHQPPIGTCCDRTTFGEHIGSTAVRAAIVAAQPRVCFTGHVHEGRGVDTIGNTLVINPGPLWMGGYAYAYLTNHETLVECRTVA